MQLTFLILLQDVLLSLPGVNKHNVRAIITNVKNLYELSRMSEDALSAIVGTRSAKLLFEYFNQKLTTTDV